MRWVIVEEEDGVRVEFNACGVIGFGVTSFGMDHCTDHGDRSKKG